MKRIDQKRNNKAKKSVSGREWKGGNGHGRAESDDEEERG